MGGPEHNNNGKIKMKVKCCVVFAWLVLGIFNQRAVACVTANSDLSGGAWETSAATDPCMGLNHGVMDLAARPPSDPALSTQNGASMVGAQTSTHHESDSPSASLLLLVMASCLGLRRYNWDRMVTGSGAILVPEKVLL